MSIDFNAGGTGNPIALTEPDGTPLIDPVTEIQVTNGTLTTLSPGVGLIDTSGADPVVIYVVTEAEFLAAFDTLNLANIGGIIKIGATIPITADRDLDFGNAIEVHGGQNRITMNNGGSWKLRIMAGTRATFKQCTFDGSVNFNQGVPNEEDTNSQVVLDIDTITMNSVVLLEVQFTDIVGGSLGNNTGVGVYNGATNVLEGAPIQITNMAVWSRMLLSNVWILTPTSGQRKPYGSVGINFISAGTLGMAFTCNNWSVSGPANTNDGGGIPNTERWNWASSGCRINVNGTGITNGGYAIINFDQSVGIDPNTNTSWQYYPTFHGPVTYDQDVNPTATATYGNNGDLLQSQYGTYYKYRATGVNTSWKNLLNLPITNSVAISVTPTISQCNSWIVFNNALPCTFLIPRNGLQAYPIGTIFKVSNIGVGALTIDQANIIVTFYKVLLPASTAFILTQYEVCTITCIAVNTYICSVGS